jgi:hypothetical protein
MIIEPHNFARIHLALSRLADFSSVIHRIRALVRYIWLCLELQEYDFTRYAPSSEEVEGLSNADNTRVMTAFHDLFSTLSTWEPKGKLMLDISVQSPSESENWCKYLTFGPDITSGECDWNLCPEKSMLVSLNDHKRGWIAGSQNSVLSRMRIFEVSHGIMGEEPFPDDNQENQWWLQLPLVPAVTGKLLRQQNCRRWKPTVLAQIFIRLPRLQEIFYEPWREIA